MKKSLNLICLFSLILFINSCGADDSKDEIIDTPVDETFIDNANAEVTAADTSSTGVYQEAVDEKEGNSLKDAISDNTEDVVAEGGLSFCDCVKKNKELSDIMMSDNASDEEFDKAMADLEILKTGDCKILFSTKQNTVEGKKAHERKVKKCLGK